MNCPKCNFKNPNEFQFCGKCGTSFVNEDDVRNKDQQERRQLTVMFCDLVNSTGLSQHLDPENLQQVINQYQERCETIVKNLDGYIAQFLGDGILIYFGYPKALEDGAQRAAMAALEIKDEIGNIDIPVIRKTPLRVRIGIHTGNVVMGDVGGASRKEQLAFGDVPNIAAMIQKQANPNQILTSQNTYQIIKGYYTTRKKNSTSSNLYSILNKKETYTRFESHMSSRLTPLVGRIKELNTLNSLWTDMKNGQSAKVCLVNGEAGVGKSRLVYEFTKSIHSDDHLLLECQCWNLEKNNPLYPIVSLLERMFGFLDKDSDSVKVSKLEKFLRNYRFRLKDIVPLFTHLISISIPSKYKMPIYSPEKLKRESMEAFIKLLEKLSEKAPLVFVVEDIHWADPSTLELIDILINDCKHIRILSIFTHRPELQPKWNNYKEITNITLTNLNKADSKEFVLKALDSHMSVKTINEVIDKSDGIPLYLEEITKTVIELRDKDRSVSIPITLSDYFMSRLDSLGEAKEVAQVGSVIGREFNYTLLISVLDSNPKALERSIYLLVEGGIIFEHGPDKYIFKHALIQDAAYESILKNQRRKYHSKIAKILENKFHFITESQPELLAYHLEYADLFSDSITYLTKASSLAMAKSAYQEVINQMQYGLKLLKKVKNTEERDFLEVSLLKNLQVALFANVGLNYTHFYEISERLISMCKKVNKTEDQMYAMHILLNILCNEDLPKTQYYLREMNRTMKNSSNLNLAVSSIAISGSINGYMGNYVKAINYFDKAIDLYDLHNLAYSGPFINTKIEALGQSSHVAFQLGLVDKSSEIVIQVLKLSRCINKPMDLVFTLIISSMHHLYRNQFNLAKKLSLECKKLSEKIGLNMYLSMAEIVLMYSNIKLGNSNKAMSRKLKNITNLGYYDAILSVSIFQEYLVESLTLISEDDYAIELLRNSIKRSVNKNIMIVSPKLYRLLGDYLLNKSDKNMKKAEENYIKSIEIARKQKTKFFELRTTISFSNLLIKQDRKAEAKKMLSRIVRWFDGRNKTEILELNEAKSLLAELS